MSHLSRRTFLASTAAASLALAAEPTSTSEKKPAPATTSPRKLKVGLIGVGGRGWNHVMEVSALPNAQVIAICDVDTTSLVKAARQIPASQAFVDFRSLLKVEGLEAVLICTPDHTHAVIAAAAMRAGKHVYCEKPLTHTIFESRQLVKLAEESGVVTQTGVQNHSESDDYRRVVELIQSNAIGPVHEVHIWHNRVRRPFSEDLAPVPAALNYDRWLGPQAERPFRKGYHPYSWRHWWDFGNGQIGDQSSHFLDLVFWSLGLTHATKVSAQSHEPVKETMVCNFITAQYEFPARDDKPAVKLFWYDNPKKPADIDKWGLPKDLQQEGVMFIGSEGMVCCDYSDRVMLPAEKFKDFTPPPQTLGKPRSHQGNWVDACLKNDPKAAGAPFSYGALLCEVPMLGTIAFRAGKTLEWDWQSMKFTNAPEAEKLLSYTYREGWTL